MQKVKKLKCQKMEEIKSIYVTKLKARTKISKQVDKE